MISCLDDYKELTPLSHPYPVQQAYHIGTCLLNQILYIFFVFFQPKWGLFMPLSYPCGARPVTVYNGYLSPAGGFS